MKMREDSWWRGHPHQAMILLFLTMTMVATGALTAACGGAGEDSSTDKHITIGYIPWDEDIAVTYLWKDILEGQGYAVELQQLEVGPLFDGVASGDLDLFFDVWLPTTHGTYWNQYGDQVEQLGEWYDQASLTWAVPEYVQDVNSISDLRGKGEIFGGEIVGIEAGAGLTEASRDRVIPQYDLGAEYTLRTSSTPAMLAQLERAIERQEPVVVTLWHPHWAYSAYPIKDLADPHGALGGTERLYVIGRPGFSRDQPEVTQWISRFRLNDEQLSTLEHVVVQEYPDNPQQGATQWLADHPDFLQGLGITP